ILLLGLSLTLAAEPPTCPPLTTVTLDNATIHRILGEWTFIAGASRYQPHLEELKAVKFAVFTFSPGSHEDELNVTETMRMNETCVVSNTSKILIFWHNSTLAHVDDQMFSTAQLIRSDEDLLVMKHVNNNAPGLSLSARTPNVTKEQMEEFKAQVHCLGFTEDEVFLTS
ncbi:A1AG protein, partial [Turnix velox]|nr:A1AG protein [Turnix velox]